jgi:CHASE3 domain sensor protein
MKSKLFMTVSLLVLIAVIVSAVALWHLSETSHFSRQPAPSMAPR